MGQDGDMRGIAWDASSIFMMFGFVRKPWPNLAIKYSSQKSSNETGRAWLGFGKIPTVIWKVPIVSG